ncbi:MAG: type VI secretion system-associated FHA domain protein TagH, partial [Gammaproteobacteria bacterium]
MPLTLTITSAGKEAPGLQRSKVFETRGGTIGRTQGNDWVLPDPERFVSGRHARVEYRDGMYYLGDTSTNGVFVNGSSQSVGAGNFVALSDGDRLLIGDYEISVRVEGGEMPAPDPFAPGMADDGGEALAITSPTIPPEVPSEQKPQAIPEDPFAFLDQAPPSSPPGAFSEQKPQAISEDPFAFLDEAPPSPASPWESPLGDRPDEPAPQQAESSFDQGSPLDEFFAPPSTGGEQIPEDWDLTGFSSSIPPEPADEPAGPDADGVPPADSPFSDAPPDRPSASAQDTGTPAGGSYAGRAPVRD